MRGHRAKGAVFSLPRTLTQHRFRRRGGQRPQAGGKAAIYATFQAPHLRVTITGYDTGVNEFAGNACYEGQSVADVFSSLAAAWQSCAQQIASPVPLPKNLSTRR